MPCRFVLTSPGFSLKVRRERSKLRGDLLVEEQVRQSSAMSRSFAKYCRVVVHLR
jgi:hypothetical protein